MAVAANLKAKAFELFMQALALTARPPLVSCDHADAEFVRGNLVHCKCGQSFKVKCHHTQVSELLPRVYQCDDCGETRGMGAA